MAFTPNPGPNQDTPADASVGILGHIAIHALGGAVRGLQAQQTRRLASDEAVAPAAADQPVATAAQAPAESVASAEDEQRLQNPRGPAQPVDPRLLVNAQLQYHALRNLQMAHDIAAAKKLDPRELQILQTQARNAQVALAQKAESLGLTKIASGLMTYSEANDLGLAQKLGRGQILPVANPDGSVDVYELSPNAMYTRITKPIEIRKPIGLSADSTVKWEVVGMIPPGGMTQLEALTQIILPELRAASAFIRTRKENA